MLGSRPSATTVGSGRDNQQQNFTTDGGTSRHFRCGESSRRAATRRKGIQLQQLHQNGGTVTVHRGMVQHNYKIPTLKYEDIKEMMDKKVAQQKKGMLTDKEIELMIRGW